MRGLCVLLLFVAASTAQKADHSAEGLKAMEAEQYAAAAQSFAKAIEADPKDYYAHFNLALAYTFLRKDPEAAAEYKQTLALKPGLYEAELNGGIVLLRQGDAAGAAPLLTHAVEQKPAEFRPRVYLAQALLAVGDAPKAAAHFQTAVQLDASSAAAELGLAQSLARQNQVDEAAPHFRRAAALDASYQDVLLELAALYERAGKPADAIPIYRQFPANAAAQERLGALLLDTKDYAAAIPNLETAYAKDPTAANRVALAAAYLFNKQLDKALPLLSQAVAAEPANCDLRLMYARALRDQKQYAPAARQFYEAVKLKPDSRETWNDLAGMLYLVGDFPQSLAAFDKARQLGDTSPANWYFRAIIQDRLKDLPNALASYQRFLEMSTGQRPDEEFKARQRIRVIQKELSKR